MNPTGSVTQPCDAGVVNSSTNVVPCPARSVPFVLAATILGSSLAFIDGTVVNVALPALQADLNATVFDLQWIIEAYALMLAALLLVGGSLGDIYGRKKIFTFGVIIFAVASAFCGLARDVHQLIAARALQGIGAALLIPGSLAIISASFDRHDRGRAFGTWSAFTSITSAAGPVLGGWLIEHASWHWVFFINLPLAAVVVVLAVRHVPESRNRPAGQTPDWLGAALATAGLGGIVFAFIESSVRGWNDPVVIAALLMGTIALFAFIAVEKYQPLPLLPLDLFREHNFTGANLLTLFLYTALSATFFFLPMNLIQVQGYTATAAAAAFLPFIGLMFLLSRWSGSLVNRFGARRLLTLGPTVAAIGFGLFALPPTGITYWSKFFPAIVALGLGMAITVAPLTTVVMNSVGEDRAGIASGVNNAVSRLAAVLAIALFSLVMLASFNQHLDRYLADTNLNFDIRQGINAQRPRLAAMRVADEVRPAVNESFVAGFRLVMWINTSLGLASAATAWLAIREED